MVRLCRFVCSTDDSCWLWVWFQNCILFWTQKWCQKNDKNQGTETRHELCVSDFCPPTFCHVLAPVLGHLYDSKRHPMLRWKSMDRFPHCSGQSLPLVKGDGLQMCKMPCLQSKSEHSKQTSVLRPSVVFAFGVESNLVVRPQRPPGSTLQSRMKAVQARLGGGDSPPRWPH